MFVYSARMVALCSFFWIALCGGECMGKLNSEVGSERRGGNVVEVFDVRVGVAIG